MSPPGELSNIEKDYAAGWREIWVLCGNAHIQEQVETEWEPRKGAFPDCTVAFYLVSDPRFDSGADSDSEAGA